AEEGAAPDPILTQMKEGDEQRLLTVLRSVGRLDTVYTLLGRLAQARPQAASVRDALFEVQLLLGRRLLYHCTWLAAEPHLAGMPVPAALPALLQATYYNLAGCAACLTQDFRSGAGYFQAALRLAGHDPLVHQNLALAHEWLGDLDRAELHWNRFFDLQER